MKFQNKYHYYKNKINDVIVKCPIEFGIEILVYNMIDSIIESEEISVVDISSILKNRDNRLTTKGGVPDIAILSKDFIYRGNKGTVYGFVEIKAPSKNLKETTQIKRQKQSTTHFIYTNGLVWRYYKKGESHKEIKLTSKENLNHTTKREPVDINEHKFNELINLLQEIDWIH